MNEKGDDKNKNIMIQRITKNTNIMIQRISMKFKMTI